MGEQFEATAVKLSEGPLGIVALFIVLIHAFASLVVGLAPDVGEFNRSVLVWFLVLFPVIVFGSFAWLVSRHHEKLYPPQAFKDEKIFQNLVYGKPAFDRPRDMASRRGTETEAHVALKHDKTGSIYWLGHDLMWAADTLLRQAPAQQVVIGLAQARHHLAQVGLGQTDIAAELDAVSAAVLKADELRAVLRDEYANKIGVIIDRIGTIAEGQGKFEVPPHWSRSRG